MANRYYATFVPGMQKVVEAIVRERLSDVKIERLLDGAVIFETQCTYDKLNFFCFNNIFAVIDVAENSGGETALEAYMRAVRGLGPQPVIAENTKKIRSFRVVCSLENTPAAVNERVRQDTERYIAAQSGLTIDRSRPDTEFWFLSRREGLSVFMKRLTRHGSFEKTLHPGELPPPLAYLLCRLSGPNPGDIVADPFCGYGAIPVERLKRFPADRFYASDKDGKAIAWARKKITGTLNSRCDFRQADLYELPALLPPESLDAIITDPPWGLYQSPGKPVLPIGPFYADMAGIFAGLLKPGGTAVVLTARQEELTAGAAKTGRFVIQDTIPILLSGKKAAVFVLKKR
jgi:23S rRNA G2445 N2-methylase RlmL